MTLILRIRNLIAVFALCIIAPITAAQDNNSEIEYLLTAVGSSNCVFVRNGTRHSAESAESHLRMKYGKTRRYIDNAEEFITKLASESSWTGKPYTLDCPNKEEQVTKDWLFVQLNEYRTEN